MSTASVHIYHLDIRARACRARVTLNGFPMVELDAGADPREATRPINPWLVGADNDLRVTAWPADEATSSAALCEGLVRRFSKGGVVGPGTGELVTTIDIPAEQREHPGPWSSSASFATADAPSFADRLRNAAPLHDEAALISHALHIRDLVLRADTDGLVEQMRPKIEDYAQAFDEAAQAFETDLRGFFETKIFPQASDVLDFAPEDLAPRSHCDGRIWELCLSSGDALIRSHPEQPRRSVLPVYVGDVRGSLMIVR